MKFPRFFSMGAALSIMLLSGCATKAPPYDYTAFINAKPASILVLPPVNESPDVKATPGVWANATRPLAEAGYYVFPVTLVDETFRQNGLSTANEIQEVSPQKLREYFGADAALYLKVKQYGTAYAVIASETRVAVEGRLVDLRSGELLWQGKAAASSAEQQQQSQGGLIGLLVTAVVKQILATSTDAAFGFAATANQRLLGAPQVNGVLPGPRSPLYGKPPVTQ